jgi:D-aminoacyl-tRNA deacylase
MRALVQRVSQAAVDVEGERVAQIGPGMLVLLGVRRGDTAEQADRLAEKVRALRIFDDAEGRMNEPLGEREVLCVSQFTLYGDACKGNRPSYVDAAPAVEAAPSTTASASASAPPRVYSALAWAWLSSTTARSPSCSRPEVSAGERPPASIRAATERDAVAIVALWTTAYVTEVEGGRTEPYAEADFADTATRGDVFVAEREGAVVGVVALFAPGAPGRAIARADEAELSRLVVGAAARHEGIGRALVVHCEELARAQGWAAITLWSRRYQTAAHRLYESLDYRRAPERDSVDATGHERVVFHLDL